MIAIYDTTKGKCNARPYRCFENLECAQQYLEGLNEHQPGRFVLNPDAPFSRHETMYKKDQEEFEQREGKIERV